MNINVNSIGFGSKIPVSRIKFARDINNKEFPIDNYVKEMLSEYGQEIETVAKQVGKDVVLAQKGNLLIANSGVKTSVVDMNKMKSGRDLVNGITHNLKINA